MKNSHFLSGIAAICLVGLVVISAELALRRPPGCRRTSCLSNLKQLGLALIQYSQDNDETLPNVAHPGPISNGKQETWRSDIYPYIKSHALFQCPARTVRSNGPDGFPRSYAANDSGTWGGGVGTQGDGAFASEGAKPLTDADYSSPSSLIALCETSRNLYPDFDADDPQRFAPQYRRLWAGHQGKFSVLFDDGHAKSLAPLESVDVPQIKLGQGTSDQSAINGQPSGGLTGSSCNAWYRNCSQPLSANGMANLASPDRSHKSE